jgi:DMSO/TMAO reductase YedYZ heme-binding membrane subunit
MWRRLHVFTLLIYALAVIHGIFSGSDTTSWWGISIYSACLLLIGTFVSVRLSKLGTFNQKRTSPIATQARAPQLAPAPQPRATQAIRTSPMRQMIEQ